eukprot:9367566-Pyramimonas_sp.AAC.1
MEEQDLEDQQATSTWSVHKAILKLSSHVKFSVPVSEAALRLPLWTPRKRCPVLSSSRQLFAYLGSEIAEAFDRANAKT